MSANLVVCADILRRWLDVTFPNQTPDQVAAVDVFGVDITNLFADRVHVTEQVLVGVGAPLAVSFNIPWNAEQGLIHGAMEWILDQVETANPGNRLDRVINALSQRARQRIHLVETGFQDMGEFMREWHHVFAIAWVCVQPLNTWDQCFRNGAIRTLIQNTQ